MLICTHAKPGIESNPPFRHQGTIAGPGRTGSGGLGRSKDCGVVAVPGGPATRLDCGRPRRDAHELESLDPPDKRLRGGGSKTSPEGRAAFPTDFRTASSLGEGPGEIPS